MKYAGIFQVAPSPSYCNSTLFRSTRSPKSLSPSIPLSFPSWATYPKDTRSHNPQISQMPVLHEQKWDDKHTHKHEPKIKIQSMAGLTHGLRVTCYLEKPLALCGRLLFFTWTTGQSVEDLNNVKTQCTAPALQLMLLGQGLLGRIVPACIVNDSGTPVVSNYQWQQHTGSLKLPIACPSAHD